MSKLIASIDPGVKTGLAIWDCEKQSFRHIATLSIVEAMHDISDLNICGALRKVIFEDARLRKWYGKNSASKIQGAGSIKRDCSIWQEFCEYYNIPFEAVAPQKGQTKWSAEKFKRLTGWTGRTSEHARDAALLVWWRRRKTGNYGYS